MGKLYLFGDSFTAEPPTNNTSALKLTRTVDTNNVWTYKLAEMLDCKPIFVAVNGSGLDYAQFQFNKRLRKFNKNNDYIIISHTAPSRRWFVEKAPHCSNFLNYIHSNGELDTGWLKQMLGGKEVASNGVQSMFQADIGRHYALGIARPELEHLYGESIITYFRYYQKQGYNIINLPATHEPDSYNIEHNEFFKTIGNIDTVARNEFRGKDKLKAFTEILQGADGRVNHLSKENHEIFTQKLYKTFTESADLDLTTDFKQNFITKENWDTYNTTGVIPKANDSNESGFSYNGYN
tara:strand:- start:228 stop:1109 length:882 start_codon:yes stop_codon:yes gene_type:complete